MRSAAVGEGYDEQEFQEKANRIREECWAERLPSMTAQQQQRELLQLCPNRPVNNPAGEIGAVGSHMPKWQFLSVAVDSGAAETVIPHTLIDRYPIRETEASRSGLNYASATGDPIPNLGEQKLPLVTAEGSLRAITFRAAPVDRPLGSVKRMCSSGHVVVFDEDGSYVYNKASGEITSLREENGNYMMDVWVMPSDTGHASGFPRPR